MAARPTITPAAWVWARTALALAAELTLPLARTGQRSRDTAWAIKS